MTTMDSDSESQDSDDGRRFRFEATRKDAIPRVDPESEVKSPKKKSKHKSRFEDQHSRDRKERSRHEGDRKESRTSKDRDADDKDLKYTTKHAKHSYDSKSIKYEDNKSTYKDHRDTRDLTLSERNFKNSHDSKEGTRESRYYRDRDRSNRHKRRSRERSYNRNHDEKSLDNKHRSRGEKYKHRSRDKSRDRLYKSKSSDNDRSREEYGRHESCRKISRDEIKAQHIRDYSPYKSDEQTHDGDSQPSALDEIVRTVLPKDNQDCKDLDLSDFDVLSETEEHFSDRSDQKDQTSPSYHCNKSKANKRYSKEPHEHLAKKHTMKSEQHLEDLHKVNPRNSDSLSGSSNNNPSAVSDFLLGITSPTAASSMKDHMNYESQESDSTDLNFSRADEDLQDDFDGITSDERSSKRQDIGETADDAYGPALPPTLQRSQEKSPSSLCDYQSENNLKDIEIDDFVGPRFPPTTTDRQSPNHYYDSTCQNEDQDSSRSTCNPETVREENLTFGPALPPHLVQKNSDSPSRIIGPTLPSMKTISTVKTGKSLEASESSEDEDAIGPLPMDHPALRDSYVHQQLEQRARKIQDGYREEVDDISSKREEWMTELPPAHATNLGLGPRKFRIRPGPNMSDRSCWTDTPGKKSHKQKEKEKEVLKESHKKMKIREEESVKSKKREKSLLEMHQAKLHKKKKKEDKEAKLSGISTRRPFDRDIDLNASRFDQAQKKTILMKAQLLDDRFSRGEM